MIFDGKRLKDLREAQGLSQSDLEKKTGIKREYISKLEGGHLKNPTFNTMTKLAIGLGFPDAAIFLASDPKEANARLIAAAPNMLLTLNWSDYFYSKLWSLSIDIKAAQNMPPPYGRPTPTLKEKDNAQ